MKFVLLSLLLSITLPANSNTLEHIVQAINTTAQAQQIDGRIIAAIIKIESDFNPNALSPKGAQGLMQLMPHTQAEVATQHPFAIDDNIAGGTRYFIKQYHRFAQSIDHALWAYNAGPSRVTQGIKPDETEIYIQRFYLYLHALTVAENELKQEHADD